ncbi:MAG: prepilin-type N-terminal cleavage/methylation domain-containing protein [Burkholderiaceae bacterium]
MIRRTPRRGFTLLELLIAISVLSLVSIIAWRGLDTLVATRERLAPEGDDVRALLTAFGQLERDAAHVVNPTLFALATNPVQVRLATSGQVLEIVRIAPPDGSGALAVQQVFYRVDDGALLRQATPATRALAPVDAAQLSNVRLLGAVASLRVRLWQPGVGWVAADQPGSPAPAQAAVPPQGIEVSIERSDGKTYRRVLLVG